MVSTLVCRFVYVFQIFTAFGGYVRLINNAFTSFNLSDVTLISNRVYSTLLYSTLLYSTLLYSTLLL